MLYREYGKENKEIILLLHGGGLSWWNYREAAEILQADYRVILPVLDGHAESGRDFTSIEENAAAVIQLIDAQFGGSVLLIGGLSLGGQIALEMLSQRPNLCRFALIESALAIPSKWVSRLIAPAFGSCYGLIHHRWFSRLQFHSLGIQPSLFEDYFRDTRAISKASMIAFLRANALYSLKPALRHTAAKVHVFVGRKEKRIMRKSAERIHAHMPGSCLHVLPKLHHGAFSINHPQMYADQIGRIVQER